MESYNKNLQIANASIHVQLSAKATPRRETSNSVTQF